MAAPHSLPIEVRQAKYDALWRRLLAPPPTETDVSDRTPSDPPPIADAAGEVAEASAEAA